MRSSAVPDLSSTAGGARSPIEINLTGFIFMSCHACHVTSSLRNLLFRAKRITRPLVGLRNLSSVCWPTNPFFSLTVDAFSSCPSVSDRVSARELFNTPVPNVPPSSSLGSMGTHNFTDHSYSYTVLVQYKGILGFLGPS